MKNKQLKLVLLMPVIALLALGAVVLSRTSGMGSGAALDFERYKQDWSAMQGNKYVFRGQIDQQLSYHESTGRVLAVKNLDGAGRVPVLVPAAMKQNFEAGQRYQFRALVKGDVLVIEKAEKF